MIARPLCFWIVVAGAALILPSASMLNRRASGASRSVARFDELGWEAKVLREMPQRVTAMVSNSHEAFEELFVGTAPGGEIYRFHPSLRVETLTKIASSLGDQPNFGTCDVSRLVVTDLEGDGHRELLATTCQVNPIGRPRLYAWSLEQSPRRIVSLGVARPAIESSWSHGLGIWRMPVGGPARVFSTFCGNGEIVEYAFGREADSDGFQFYRIAWRSIGQLRASGEDAEVADADNDGAADLCLATGYSVGEAAIVIYQLGEDGVGQTPRHVIDESDQFGNVRFTVGDLCGDGSQEIVAWWCTDLCAGDAQVIRYRLGPGGVRDRAVIARGGAAELWPRDGQFDRADSDGDGQSEVWFVTGGGQLSCYDPVRGRDALRRVGMLRGNVGPLACGQVRDRNGICLYVGIDKSVVRIERSRPEASRSLAAATIQHSANPRQPAATH
jgi:hypothetical protein